MKYRRNEVNPLWDKKGSKMTFLIKASLKEGKGRNLGKF